MTKLRLPLAMSVLFIIVGTCLPGAEPDPAFDHDEPEMVDVLLVDDFHASSSEQADEQTAEVRAPRTGRRTLDDVTNEDLIAEDFVNDDLVEDVAPGVRTGRSISRMTDERTPVDMPPPTPDDALAERLAEVERELKSLKAKYQTDQKSSKGGESKKVDDGWLDMSTDKWTVRLGGHVQMEYINWVHADESIRDNAPSPGPKDYFEFRRLRLLADGTGYGLYDFRLQMTLEPETVGESGGAATTPDVKDAYFSANEIPWIGRLRIGNFFVPFSLEQVTNDTNNIFMERSIPTQGVFSGDREVGLAFYNCNAGQDVTWSGGMFFDSISETLKERIDSNQGYRLAGRLTWLPYYDEPSNGRYLVHTGVGILHTADQDRSVRFRARPQIHEGPRIIDSGAISAETYTTGNIEGAVVWGPVTIQSEAFLSTVHRTNGESTNLSGAYAHLSYFLTGENRIFERFGQHGAQFARNSPFSNFFLTPGGVGLGAWELKTRWSNLNLNNFNRGQYNDLTVGMNWYWSDRTRIMFDWIHPITSSQAIYGETSSDILAIRFDFNW